MAFNRLEPSDFVVSTNTVSSTVWSQFSPSLNSYFSSSVQKEGVSGPYYLNVYQTASNVDAAEIQFAIAYGNSTGGGGVLFDANVANVTSTRVIYGQYRTLLLEDENAQFVFGSSFTGSDFYALSIERARYKDKLLPGSMNLILISSNSNLAALHLTDNSNMVSLPTYYGTQRAYQVISGSNGLAWNSQTSGSTGYTPNSGSYGLFFPDTSIILLNAAALDDNSSAGGGINLQTVRTNTAANNPSKLYSAISGSGVVAGVTNQFELNSQETITSDFVFVRTKNSEFNYTENPSFISGSSGEVIYSYFIDNPQTFPTTVGLYNDGNELLAVAKMSRPLQKDFTKEALIRVKLDF